MFAPARFPAILASLLVATLVTACSSASGASPARVTLAPATVTESPAATPTPTFVPDAGAGPAASSASASRGRSSGPAARAPGTPAASGGPGRAASGLRGKTIVVDPGHNGGNAAHPAQINRLVPAGGGRMKACNTTGTASASGYTEHAHNFDVAQRLAKILRAEGARVVLTRDNDAGVGPCVDRRAAIGNEASADAVVSIHADGNESSSARGFHVIVSSQMTGGAAVEARSRALAADVREGFAAATGMPRSTYTGGGTGINARTDIAGMNLSTRPAVMVESGNMHHPTDAAWLASASYRQKEAQGLADGLARFFA